MGVFKVEMGTVSTTMNGKTGVKWTSPYSRADAANISTIAIEPEADYLSRADGMLFCIGVCSVKDNGYFSAMTGMTALSVSEAEMLGTLWRPQVEIITAPIRVQLILAKQARGETLTAEELAAITPSDATKGINLTPLFIDILNAEIAKRG